MRFLLLAACAVSSYAVADPVDDLILQTMEAQRIPGLSLLVVKNGKVVKQATYGFADIASKKQVTPETIFETGSIGKSFTATLIMQLVGERKLALNATIRKYLPWAPESWQKIEVRHLLSQQSGLPEYVVLPGLGLANTYTDKQFRDGISKLPLDFEPGLMFQYSNTNYALLGHIAESVTRKKYGDLVRERIFKPAGMRNTAYMKDFKDIESRMASGYMLDSARNPQTGIKTTTSGIGSDGMFVSTPNDLVRFAIAFAKGRLVPISTAAEMQTGALTNSGRRSGYGLGWFTRKINGQRFISHGGNSVGFSASISTFPDSGLTISLMCNLYPVGGDALAKQIADIYEPALATSGLMPQPDPHPKLTAWLLDTAKSLARGETNHPALHPDWAGQLATPRGRMAMPSFAVFATIDRLEYLSTELDGGDRTIRYRGYAGARKFAVAAVVTPENKVYSIGARAE